MRILQVRFKNLNSLVGEWQIDLAHPAFASDGIFAITGPTGAGKTTILDAICLALYGRTPRLNRITRSGNEIMSRQTGECFAEVTFETPAGSFRCHWYQRRAHKKPDGELQAPRHEIASADSGKIVDSKIRGVADQIVAATGMDFDRFTRSMLLAQGGFAAFLQAAPDDRAPILEQITGTEIYSQISIRVHDRQREEREKLNLLQAETAGIVLLAPEQEQELEKELGTKEKEETSLAAVLAETGKAIAWRNGIEGLKKELADLAGEDARLQQDLAAFAPRREKLERSLAAASLDGTYATLAAGRRQQQADRTALANGEAALPGLEAAVQNGAEALKTAEKQSSGAREALQAAAPTLQKVRFLDQRLADRQKAAAQGEEDCRKDTAAIEAGKRMRLAELDRRTRTQKSLELAEGYLATRARDEWLVGGLAGIEEQCSTLLLGQKELLRQESAANRAARDLKMAEGTLAGRTGRTGQLKAILETTAGQLGQKKAALDQLLGGRLLREYRAEKETLLREMFLLKQIASLKTARDALEDGRPCPLCGATVHPYALGNVPLPDETEKKIAALNRLIGEAEDLEAAIKGLGEKEILARNSLTEAEKQELQAANDKASALKALIEAQDKLGRLRADFDERRKAIWARLQPLGIAESSETDIPSLLAALGSRLKAWQEQFGKKTETEKQLAAIDSELKRLDAVLETQTGVLAEKRQRLEALQKELETGREERYALYGDRNPETEELRFNKAILQAETCAKEARERHAALLQQWTLARAQVEALKKRLGERTPELEKLEQAFAAALEPAGFADENAFLAARLSPEQKEALSVAGRALDERETALKARARDRQARLEAELALRTSDKSLEELEACSREQETGLKELRERIAGIRLRLGENTASKGRIREKQAAIEARTNECRRWDNLHELIGSADGKKYRNFAQGLTFELMVAQANRQLQKMSDRYLLTRDPAQPLELDVIDNYQAGEIRSTKNLSGGESFIVSLSLALGLSQMASRNVRVDSLFLDEGFGTLDEEALDTALETLAGLQQEGKLIGVISHVSALKERIATQIEVSPLTGGRSKITGPGCGCVGSAR